MNKDEVKIMNESKEMLVMLNLIIACKAMLKLQPNQEIIIDKEDIDLEATNTSQVTLLSDYEQITGKLRFYLKPKDER